MEIEEENDLIELLNSVLFKNNKRIFLGGGSNVLFVKDFDGMVILNKLKGMEVLKADSEIVTVRAMGDRRGDAAEAVADRGRPPCPGCKCGKSETTARVAGRRY